MAHQVDCPVQGGLVSSNAHFHAGFLRVRWCYISWSTTEIDSACLLRGPKNSRKTRLNIFGSQLWDFYLPLTFCEWNESIEWSKIVFIKLKIQNITMERFTGPERVHSVARQVSGDWHTLNGQVGPSQGQEQWLSCVMKPMECVVPSVAKSTGEMTLLW